MPQRPAVPLHVDPIAALDGRVGGGAEPVAVADDVGVGVVGGGDEAVVDGGGGPADVGGVVGDVGAWVEAVVEGAVDEDVREVGVGERWGGEGEEG